MKTVIFKPDIGINSGMGHFFRSLALAEYLKPAYKVIFCIPEGYSNIHQFVSSVGEVFIQQDLSLEEEVEIFADKASVVVLDGYHFTTEHQRKFKSQGLKVVAIDDLHQNHFVADIVINQQPGISPESYSREPYTRLLLGPEFVLLREPFSSSAGKSDRVISRVDSIFVNMGGSDHKNITLKVIEACLRISRELKIFVVLGALYPFEKELNELCEKHPFISIYKNLPATGMAELLTSSQIAILPASSVCLEAFSIGIGTISGYTAENQMGNVKAFDEQKLTLNAGNFDTIGPDSLSGKIEHLISTPDLIQKQIHFQKKLLDGKARNRYLEVFKDIVC